MSWIQRCAEAVKRFDRRYLSPHPRIPMPPAVADALGDSKIVIADVGAAGGVDPRWDSLRPWITFLTFEPRPDDQLKTTDDSINFPVALSDQPGEKTLYVTRFPESSSLYPINYALFDDFAARGALDVMETAVIPVDTLDRIAERHGLSVDFLKLDVEGAESDVLRGAKATVEQGVLGMRMEVSFAPRQTGAAAFSELHECLRSHGFDLFQLSRQRMIRRNRAYSLAAEPQLIWADCVYFRRKDAFAQVLNRTEMELREAKAARFVLLLLGHRIVDYALEIIETSRETGWLGPAAAADLRRLANSILAGGPATVLRAAGGVALGAGILAVSWPFESTRLHGAYFFKRRCSQLGYLLWKSGASETQYTWSVSDAEM